MRCGSMSTHHHSPLLLLPTFPRDEPLRVGCTVKPSALITIPLETMDFLKVMIYQKLNSLLQVLPDVTKDASPEVAAQLWRSHAVRFARTCPTPVRRW